MKARLKASGVEKSFADAALVEGRPSRVQPSDGQLIRGISPSFAILLIARVTANAPDRAAAQPAGQNPVAPCGLS